jgi:hypothetical protein
MTSGMGGGEATKGAGNQNTNLIIITEVRKARLTSPFSYLCSK